MYCRIDERPYCRRPAVPQVFEYLEVLQRVHLLNDRFSVMQELLDILRVHVQVGGCKNSAAGWLLCCIVARGVRLR